MANKLKEKQEMNSDIFIKDELVKYILFQRTTFIKYSRGKLFSLLNKYGPFSFYEKTIAWEASLRKNIIKKQFQNNMVSEYHVIKKYLPEQCTSILDIGCGIAGIDVFLYRHYNQDENLKFYLLDKTMINKKVFYGFKQKSAFYNSLELAKEFLVTNGIQPNNIETLHATEDNQIDTDGEHDLVISLISWGFHYPVSTYIERVHELLRMGGHLIMDIRSGQGQENLLEQKFSSVKIIADLGSANRVLAIK